jgi:hypothetical protein
MKWIGLILIGLVSTCSAMQKNIVIIPDEPTESVPNKRFCCPYCFEKFFLKQLFQDHLFTHPEVAAHGPIPGHIPSLDIYSSAQEIEKKMLALHQAIILATQPPH